jgi:branched-chain amino acid transport system ATP-binding protein
MLLELKDINVHYGKIHALKDISMGIEERAIVCLIGANGAGKSTVLRTISGLTPLTGGEVRFNNTRISGLPVDLRVEFGIVHVPEGRRVFADLTVQENLNLGAYTRKDKLAIREDFEKVFNLFTILAKRKTQKAGTMSGGEQQMLAVARGLMANPKILLLDEPSLGLAPIIVAEIGDIINKINQVGTTVLLVEQNANMALRLASFGYVLEAGSIILEDKTSKLLYDERVRKAYLGG